MRALIDFAAPQAAAGTRLRGAFAAPRQTLVAERPDQVRALLQSVDALARQGCWCVGYVRYEAAPAFDPALTVHAPDGPLAWFTVFDQMQPWPADTDTGAAGAPASVQWQPALARGVFDRQIERIHQAIAAGELYQVNYTAALQGELKGDALAFFRALHRAQPAGYAAWLDTGMEQVLSVSPELFFDWQQDRLLVRPMKGTAPRGLDAAEDAQLARQLRSSPKERAENVMIVDLLRNDLSRIATPFSVRTPKLFQVETLPTVLQMSSDVSAVTRAGVTLADVFGALFPCGSITGAPKVRAMQMIKALEPQARGIYCGAIGVVRPGGDATFNVAIRSVTVRGRRVRCGIGSGITLDAGADGEWQEWRHKRGFLERASQPFELLETLRLQDGCLRDAPAHLARMARGAQHFGYPFALAPAQRQLEELAQAHPQGCWRVRLQLAADGQLQATAQPLAASPSSVVLRLAAHAFEAAGNEFVRFKTTRRAHYEALAPTDPGVFDTLLWNRHGELTECTRGNVALLLDGRWVTPPLRCGLLDGIGRARYLREQRLLEACVRVEDLPRVQALAFVNSLRGWIDAVLA